MANRILESNGVEITAIDDAVFNNSILGNQSGVLKGVRNSCNFRIEQKRLKISSGQIVLGGHRVDIDSDIILTFEGNPTQPVTYYIIASLTVQDDGEAAFKIIKSFTIPPKNNPGYFLGERTYNAILGSVKYDSSKIYDIDYSNKEEINIDRKIESISILKVKDEIKFDGIAINSVKINNNEYTVNNKEDSNLEVMKMEFAEKYDYNLYDKVEVKVETDNPVKRIFIQHIDSKIQYTTKSQANTNKLVGVFDKSLLYHNTARFLITINGVYTGKVRVSISPVGLEPTLLDTINKINERIDETANRDINIYDVVAPHFDFTYSIDSRYTSADDGKGNLAVKTPDGANTFAVINAIQLNKPECIIRVQITKGIPSGPFVFQFVTKDNQYIQNRVYFDANKIASLVITKETLDTLRLINLAFLKVNDVELNISVGDSVFTDNLTEILNDMNNKIESNSNRDVDIYRVVSPIYNYIYTVDTKFTSADDGKGNLAVKTPDGTNTFATIRSIDLDKNSCIVKIKITKGIPVGQFVFQFVTKDNQYIQNRVYFDANYTASLNISKETLDTLRLINLAFTKVNDVELNISVGDTEFSKNLTEILNDMDNRVGNLNKIKVLFLGDSITNQGQGVPNGNGWTEYFKQELHIYKSTNEAIYGATLKDNNETLTDDLIDNGDGTYSLNPALLLPINQIFQGKNNTMSTQIKRVKYGYYNKDPKYQDIQLIMLAFGTNDATLGTGYEEDQLETGGFQIPTSNLDKKTTSGAIKYAYDSLREMYPNAMIVWMTPIQSALQRCTYEKTKVKRDVIISNCDRMSMHYIDAFNCGICGIYEVKKENANPLTDGFMLNDGLHPNRYGAKVMGKYVANQLRFYIVDKE